ncbi:MAG: YifB family Mg chelatase-like AAA ATPase [Treponema sp.]|nr:YifB family Mg chelatase-like AAA ATPase [Treponema sp.]MBR7081000.1 YifB family Mg chelatase-like AAA ATPase [Treponema sp.]
MAIYSFSPFGYDGSLVNVEVDLRRGIPAVDIVGLADGSVRESRERVRSAIINSGFEFPSERVLISLSPADLKKEGDGFDLAVALAILAEKNGTVSEKVLVMGGLCQDGTVQPVRGISAALQTAVENGIKYAIVPYSMNADYPEGIKVARIGTLKEAFERLLSLEGFSEHSESYDSGIEFASIPEDNLDTIGGLDGLKYAMAVAVAGRHNILAYGAPGCGKTLTLQHMPELLPKLTKDEIPTVNRIYSLAGLSGVDYVVNHTRPFRMPHQTTTIEGMCGGGASVKPGEITLAHNGVLFLDEAAEFRSSVLQMLRVPVESGQITLCRAGRSTSFPANFQLVMAANTCPCGNYGVKDRVCLCSARAIEQYWKKFGGPLLDRIAIRYDMNNPLQAENMTLERMRSMVKGAWEIQLARQGKLNGQLSIAEADKFVKLDDGARETLSKIGDLSARAVANVMKVAQTLLDIKNANSLFRQAKVSSQEIKESLALFGKLPVEL